MKTIAVLFGGESVEHDVSILTALQFMNAMDEEAYRCLPVYISPEGRWWTGEALRKREFYPLTAAKQKKLKEVGLPPRARRNKEPVLIHRKKGLRARQEEIPFDLIVPAIHGSNGEDGTLQGLLDFFGIPYAGCGLLAAAAAMDKDFTKRVAKSIGIPVLDHLVLKKPPGDEPLRPSDLEKKLKKVFGKDPFPLIVKPCHLGSSIGVSPARTMDDLLAGLLLCFRLDHSAIVEPFVENLVEYNIAVSKAFGEFRVSVIERPLKASDFLNFKEKYLSGDDQGAKLKSGNSEGMASLNRVINPEELKKPAREKIRRWAREAFEALDLAGSVRIDFLGNRKSGKLWLNEINPVPGSFAFYLWQESKPPVSFTELTGALIEEGLERARNAGREIDKNLGGAVIFRDE